MRTNRGALSVSSAIIIAGALIAVALIWIYRPAGPSASAPSANMPSGSTGGGQIPDVTGSDHILGNPNAPIKLVEYSDLSCPYCKEFNPTLSQIMASYGASGNVAWVYRSLPILMKPIDDNGTILHPNSNMQAQALECVAQLGGNKAFFDFERQWFSTFPEGAETRSASTDRAAIDALAKKIGLDAVSFSSCLDSGKYSKKISDAYDAGLSAGITGTPTTYLFTPSGSKIPIVGAQSYGTLKNTIDLLITTIATSTGIKN